MLPLEGLEKNKFFPLLSSNDYCQCLSFLGFTPVSSFVSLWPFSLLVCVIFPNFPLKFTIVIGFRVQSNLVWWHLNLITSAQTLFTKKVTFSCSRGTWILWDSLNTSDQVNIKVKVTLIPSPHWFYKSRLIVFVNNSIIFGLEPVNHLFHVRYDFPDSFCAE